MSRCQSGKLLLVVALAAMAGGCNIGETMNIHGTALDKPKPKTIEHRIHMELIPDARIVREILPDWEPGRTGYASGDENVLVIARVTSWIPESGGPREDKITERAWIAVPSGTPTNTLVRMQDIKHDEDVAYDVKRHGLGFLNQPIRVTGDMMAKEITDEYVRLDMNVIIRPQDMDEWSVRELVTVRRNAPLVYATKADMRRVLRPQDQSVESIFGPGEAFDAGSEQEEPPDPDVQQTDVGSDDRSIIGQWITDTGTYEVRFQFYKEGEDDRYIFSTMRGHGQYAPGIKQGTFRLVEGHLVMEVESFDFGGLDHMEHRRDKKTGKLDRVVDVRAVWYGKDDNRLRLIGDLESRVQGRSLILTRTTFPDMRTHRPTKRLIKPDGK